MPDKDLSPFMPDFQGPLSGVLEKGLKPTPLEVPNPNARVGKLAATAAIASKFFEGVEAGRLRSFQNEQRERQQKWASVYRSFAWVQNDKELSEDAKAKAAKIFRDAIGAGIAREADGGGGEKGKGKGGKKEGGNPFVHFAKEFGLGIVGGHLKGEKDVDSGKVIAEMESVYDATGKPLPQYSLQGQQESLGKEIQGKLKDAGSETAARQAISSYYPKIQSLYGQDSQKYIENLVRGYPNVSPAEEAAAKRLSQNQATPPGPAGGPAPAGGTGQTGGPPTAPQSGFTPSGKRNWQSVQDYMTLYPQSTNIGKPELVDVNLNGKRDRVEAIQVTTPERFGYIDARTGEWLPAEATSSAKNADLDKKEQDLINRQKDLDAKISNIQSMITARESAAESRDRAATDRERRLSDQEKQFSASLALRKQLADTSKKVQGVRLWTNMNTNMQRSALAAQSHATKEIDRLMGNVVIAGPARDAQVHKIEQERDENLQKIEAEKQAGLRKIAKETGITFNADGEPELDEDGRPQPQPKPKTAEAKKGESKSKKLSGWLKQ